MKKELKIGLFVLSLFGVVITTAHSFSLVINGANNATFGISQISKAYYLKGSFNDWEASNDYILEDVTSSMGEEEGKISEFSITKSLAKNDELKIWDNTDHWYEQGGDNCSYVDKWSRSLVNEANYIVPMTATYTFYLKFYESGAKQIYVTAPDLTILYFKPNANWLTDGARFAAYFFNDETNVWYDLVADGDYYKIDMPTGYNKVIFCRMNPGTVENNWDNKWNQTGNLDFSATSYLNEYVLPDGTWDDATNDNWRAR